MIWQLAISSADFDATLLAESREGRIRKFSRTEWQRALCQSSSRTKQAPSRGSVLCLTRRENGIREGVKGHCLLAILACCIWDGQTRWLAGYLAAAVCSAFCRAERFGTQYVEPGKRQDLQLAFRKEKLKKDGFKTGIDIYDGVTPHETPHQRCAIRDAQPAGQAMLIWGQSLSCLYQAEMARKQQRAARFGLEDSAASYAPAEIPEDEVKKQQRAERFGVDYKPAEGLMDIGNAPSVIHQACMAACSAEGRAELALIRC